MHITNSTPVQDSTILKLLKIKNLSENAGTREEAFTAAEQLQRLLLKHKLELSDLEAVKIETDEPVEKEYVKAEGFGFEFKNKKSSWLGLLAKRVAEAHCCSTITVTGSNTQIFVGRKSDREVAIKSFAYLAQIAQQLADEAAEEYGASFKRLYAGHKPDARGFKNSFLRGFVNEIGDRLDRQKIEIEKEATGESNESALMVIRNSEHAVKDFFEEARKNGSIVYRSAPSYRASHNSTAYGKGKAQGSKISLSGNVLK